MKQEAAACGAARWRVLGAALLTLTCGGCQGGRLPASAERQMAEAERQYRGQDYAGANRTLDTLLRDYPQHATAAQAYYLRALIYSKTSKKDMAGQDAQMCLKLSQDVELTCRCHATLAELLFERGDMVGALTHYDKAMPHLVEQQPADVIHYHYGVCLQKAGRWAEAREQFQAVVQRYPGSAVGDRARQMLDWRGAYFSIQCGAFREEPKARELADRLKRAGLAARVEMRQRLNERLYMVYVGQYADQPKAEAALPTVRRHARDALVVP